MYRMCVAALTGRCIVGWQTTQSLVDQHAHLRLSLAGAQMALSLLAVSSGLLYYYLNKEDRDRNRNLGALPARHHDICAQRPPSSGTLNAVARRRHAGSVMPHNSRRVGLSGAARYTRVAFAHNAAASSKQQSMPQVERFPWLSERVVNSSQGISLSVQGRRCHTRGGAWRRESRVSRTRNDSMPRDRRCSRCVRSRASGQGC